MVEHTFNPGTWESEASGSLSLRISRATQRNPVFEKSKQFQRYNKNYVTIVRMTNNNLSVNFLCYFPVCVCVCARTRARVCACVLPGGAQYHTYVRHRLYHWPTPYLAQGCFLLSLLVVMPSYRVGMHICNLVTNQQQYMEHRTVLSAVPYELPLVGMFTIACWWGP